MKTLGAAVVGAFLLVAGAAPADALVLCVNASGNVTALDQCKAGMTQLAPAAAGLVGPAGPTGAQGPAGPAGPVGPAGSNPVYFTALPYFETIFITQYIKLDLPAGTFLVTGKGYITSAAYGSCYLVSGPEKGAMTNYDGAPYPNGTIDFLALVSGKVTLTEPDSVAMRCGNGFGENWSATYSTLSAVPVAP